MTRKPSRRNLEPSASGSATRDDLNEFIGNVAKARMRFRDDDKAKQDEAVREYLSKVGTAELQRLMARAYVDALKSPSQKRGTAQPEAEAPANTRARRRRRAAPKKPLSR